MVCKEELLVTYKEFGVARLFLNVPTLKPDSYERFLVKLKGVSRISRSACIECLSGGSLRRKEATVLGMSGGLYIT